jgi:hypothetical protein
VTWLSHLDVKCEVLCVGVPQQVAPQIVVSTTLPSKYLLLGWSIYASATLSYALSIQTFGAQCGAHLWHLSTLSENPCSNVGRPCREIDRGIKSACVAASGRREAVHTRRT